jgi:hypothetical protein
MKHLTGVLSLFLFASLPLYAADLSDLTYRITGGQVTITDCDEAATGGLLIPNTIEGNPVTSIGQEAFNRCTSLTSITIPDSVTSIGDWAFARCSALTNITIPDSVTSIGDAAFYKCTGLTSITIPDGVTSIGSGAFYKCTGLTSITIPDGVTSIGDDAFYYCSSLASITIPDSITSIGVFAFYNCAILTNITIPDSVTSIGVQAFQDCSSLTSVTIGNSVTSIGDFAFRSCISLTGITIPDSVTSIGRQAFFNCSSLTNITFQGSAPEVGVDAFLNVAGGANATVTAANLSSFGSDGESWNGLILSTADQSDAIADLAAQLATVTAERDAILSDIQLAYDEVNAAAGGAEADLVEVVDPENASLVTRNAGVIAQPLGSFEVNTFASPANLDTEMALYDSAGTLIANNDDAPSAALPEGAGQLLSQLNFPDGLAGGVYYLAVGTYNSIFNSDFAVSSNGEGGEYTLTLPTGPVSGTLEASGIDWYRIEIGTNFAALQLQPLTELYRNLVEANASAISERDARYTEDQIRGLSADYTIGLNNAGNVQMKFNLFESADLNTFAPLTLNPDSVSVVDGSICLEFAPEDRAAFFRFNVE